MNINNLKARIKSAPVIYIIVAVLLILLIFRIFMNISDRRKELSLKGAEWDKLLLVLHR